MSKTYFSTELSAFGNNTGIEVPDAKLADLNFGKRPPVLVKVNDYEFRSTVAVMGGKNLISFSKAHRESSGIKAGDKISVTLTLEEGPREVAIPDELSKGLKENNLIDKFSNLSYSKRKEFARQINDAKADETKSRRLAKIIDQLKA